MTPFSANGPAAPVPPWESLRERLLERSRAMAASGDGAGADALLEVIESWWREQQAWDEELRRVLMANHEINNALVGVTGNAQLMLMSQAAGQPGVRERIEVILREAARVERVARALGETKARLGLGQASAAGEGESHGGHAAYAR